MKVLDECIESSYFSGAGDKIKWGPYGNCTFPQNVLGQMQVFRNTLRGWVEVVKNTKSDQRWDKRRRETKKDTLCKSREDNI